MVLDVLNFDTGVFPGKSPTDYWAFASQSNWYTLILSPFTMFLVDFARKPSYFSSMAKLNCTLPPFRSSVSWCGTHIEHCLWAPTWLCKILFKTDMVILNIFWRSFQVIRTSILISCLTRVTFPWPGSSRNRSATTVILIKIQTAETSC